MEYRRREPVLTGVRRSWIATAVVAFGTTASDVHAGVQPIFCYGIHGWGGNPTPVVVTSKHRLGVRAGVMMRPAILCAPAKTGGGVDPLPPGVALHVLSPEARVARRHRALPMFGTGTYTITSRRLLCAPAVKELGSPSGAFLP
jgi:hypothetical protein